MTNAPTWPHRGGGGSPLDLGCDQLKLLRSSTLTSLRLESVVEPPKTYSLLSMTTPVWPSRGVGGTPVVDIAYHESDVASRVYTSFSFSSAAPLPPKR